MLDSIDTLVAFIVIMSVASLLVTIVVQMISAAFCLRGSQLREGLAHVFQGLVPDAGQADDLRALAERLIADPQLVQPLEKEVTGFIGRWLSKFLFWAPPLARFVSRLFKAQALKEAVRPEELFASLKKLQPPPAAAANQGATAANQGAGAANQGAGAAPSWAAWLKSKVQAAFAPVKTWFVADPAAKDKLAAAAKAVLDALGQNADATKANHDALLPLQDALNQALVANPTLTTLQDALATLSKNLTGEANAVRGAFDKAFLTAQDRAQEWFLHHVRYVTIIVGIALAFVFQWDAVEIYKQVSVPGPLKASLVGAADSVNKAIDQQKYPASLSGGLLEDIQEKWNSSDLVKAHKELELSTSTTFKNIADMEALIKTQAAGLKDAKPDEVTAAFKQLSEKDMVAFSNEKLDAITKLSGVGGFAFIPKDTWRWEPIPKTDTPVNFTASWPALWSFLASLPDHFGPIAPHLPGILMFAALLSLGSPFWFNALKSLSNLRPVLAELTDPKPKAPPAGKDK